MRRSKTFIRIFLALSMIVPQGSITIAAANGVRQTTTGTLVGRVLDESRTPVPGARVKVINQDTGNPRATTTDASGRYQVAYLQPGRYVIEASHPNYVLFQPTAEPIKVQLNRTIETLPDIIMRMIAPVVTQTPTGPTTPVTPVLTAPVTPPVTTAPIPTPTPMMQAGDESTGRLTTPQDATRRFNADERMINQLPLAGIRTFDDLAFLFPGVAPPPAVLGVVGPGIGAGIGTAGQFSVNGMRARSNNFTVDGSDNNDEDVGVRRQGFVALVPQSIESIQDFQIVTSLWDSELGRSMGSQVNAVSRSGGRQVHGAFYDFISHDALNARNFFDYTDGPSSYPLRGLRSAGYNNGVPINPTIVPVRIGTLASPGASDFTQPNPSGGEDPFHRHQAGLTLGVPFSKKLFGPLGSTEPRTFFFGSFERQVIRAQQETHFAVPTVEERGFLNFGTTGILATDRNNRRRFFFPTSVAGDGVFSLFPFANNPIGP
ncbi:MAG: carboxypeptidase-like regulatory domain-containing protein, partial [Acidobacteriota bacterium]